MTKIKAIIFDFDGVIVNTFKPVLKEIRKKHPKAKLEDLKKLFEGNIYRKIKYGLKLDLATHAKDFEKLYTKTKIENKIKRQLRKLSKNYKLFILTSNVENNVESVLKLSKFEGVFEKILAADFLRSKTKKFKHILNKYNLSKNECVFVTDTLGDILEANKVGIKTIAVNFGYHEKDRLEKGKPHKIVSNFKDIREEIKKFT